MDKFAHYLRFTLLGFVSLMFFLLDAVEPLRIMFISIFIISVFSIIVLIILPDFRLY